MIPMIICEINKKARNEENSRLQKELNGITDELHQYKTEYAR